MLDDAPGHELEFRARAAGALALGALTFAAPFAVMDLVMREHVASGLCTLALSLALAGHALLVPRAPRLSWITAALLVPLTIAALVLSLRVHGVGAIFWCYPVVLGFCCLLPERAAWAACALMTVTVLSLAWGRFEPEIVVRAGATLVVVTLFAATVVRVIAAQARRLQAHGETDPLTGLANRRSLHPGLERAIADAGTGAGAGAGGTPMSLLALDIDDFKRVNDDFGHATGDEVLRATGTFLRERTRAGDIAWRTGGEEFLVLLRGAGRDDALRIARELVREYPERVARPDGRATFSVGLAALEPGETADAWMRRADRALYRAKATGRDRVVECPPRNPVMRQPSSAADSSGSSSNRSPTSP